MSGEPSGDLPRGFAVRPGLTVCSLCAGETLAATEALPGGQMSRLERLEASGVTRLTVVECLDECKRGDVVVARPAPHHRAAGAAPVWFACVAGDVLTDELARWLRLGGPGAAPVPSALRALVIRTGDRPPSETWLHDGHSTDPRDLEASMTTRPTTMTDPVCAMTVDPDTAAASTEFAGEAYYFCSNGCLRSFLAEPAQYVTA